MFTCSGCGIEKSADSFRYTRAGRRFNRCIQCNVGFGALFSVSMLTRHRHEISKEFKIDKLEQQRQHSKVFR